MGRLIPLRLGIISLTTIVSNGSDTTTYICGAVHSRSEEEGPTYRGRRGTGSKCIPGVYGDRMIDDEIAESADAWGSFGCLWVRALITDVGLTFRRVINVKSRTNGTELGSCVGALKAKRCS